MKQYRVIGASIFFCLSFLGCKNYENQKDKMIRFVCDYKAMQIENGNVDYENLCDLNRILSRFRDTMQMSLIEYCSQKREQSERDLTYIIHSGFISGYQNRYGDNLKPPTNVYHRMTA